MKKIKITCLSQEIRKRTQQRKQGKKGAGILFRVLENCISGNVKDDF